MDEQLPYVFDLHWDCKTVADVQRELVNLTNTIKWSQASKRELLKEMKAHGIQVPEDLKED